MIADDSIAARMSIKRCFVVAGCSDDEFLEASNGCEALEVLRANLPVDLLMTDISMPEKDGIELVKELRATEDLKAIPVVVFTSVRDVTVERMLFDHGVFAVLLKPIEPSKITKIVKALFTEKNA